MSGDECDDPIGAPDHRDRALPPSDAATSADVDVAATVGGALREAEIMLATAGIDGARLEATLLLGHVLGHDRAQLLAALSDPVGGAQLAEFQQLVARRSAREPLQYLRGRAPFLDFELAVRPGVFIPRPETEGLVERALELWDPADGWAVDVCTGSGAIAIGLARAKPGGRVLAIDQSTAALSAAAANAERLGVRGRIAFAHGDFLGALDLAPEDVGIVLSNPPYAADEDEVDPEVRNHEPRAAWSAGPTGMEAYELIVPQAAALLRPGRWLCLELGYDQQERVTKLLATSGCWETPAIEPDFQGIPRVLSVRRRVNHG